MLLSWQLPFYIYRCTEEFMLKNICGTFLEVHRPLDPKVLVSKELTNYSALNQL